MDSFWFERRSTFSWSQLVPIVAAVSYLDALRLPFADMSAAEEFMIPVPATSIIVRKTDKMQILKTASLLQRPVYSVWNDVSFACADCPQSPDTRSVSVDCLHWKGEGVSSS